MNYTDIAIEAIEFEKITPPCNWYENIDVPLKLRNFQEELVTSSDDFWYNLKNGYINVKSVTTDNFKDLNYGELLELSDFCRDFGIEY